MAPLARWLMLTGIGSLVGFLIAMGIIFVVQSLTGSVCR